MTEEKLAFFYGTLTFNPGDTEARFPVEFVSKAVAKNIKKMSNNVVPADGRTVEGMLFDVWDWDELDRFEGAYGYDRAEGEMEDGRRVDFYTAADGQFELRDDIEVIVEEK